MLLPPDGRSLLTDVLRPPPGYRLDRAIATTFTLELDALLAAPLAFAAHAVREEDDSISVMDAVQRCADRIDVFCQAGHIGAPATTSGLLLLLEQMVHPVHRPKPGRLFHPKLWLVRYADDQGDRQLRLVVLSRNLTNDRSWDVCLSLDGSTGSRPAAGNTPLVKLVRHAVGRTTQPVPPDRAAAIEGLLEDARRAVWDPPEGFRELAFHALGVPGGSRPQFGGTRHLVMAPFVEERGLTTCAPGNGELTVIGRQEELDRMPEDALHDCEVFVLDDLVAAGGDSELSAALHAKTYVIEYGHRAHVFVGSANATAAAFTGNVELLVELIGSKSQLGINTMIGDSAALRTILQPYERGPAPEPDDEASWQLENDLLEFAAVPFRATVLGGAEPYELYVTAEVLPQLSPGVTVTIGLLTLPGETAPLIPGTAADAVFTNLPTTSITRFLVLTATGASGDTRRAVTVAELIGDPADRLDRVLAEQIDTPEKFLRFLMLLLGLGTADNRAELAAALGAGSKWRGASPNGLLEILLGALADRPAQLDDLARLVGRMAATGQGRAVLPDGFLDLWDLVNQVRLDLAETIACPV
ncbi:phospholipase D family protein [Actinoplanes sp. GCM10030250]|uniref:phospholipase D family protein n=1 Tax=Actinoplanes sp. GCM10030250 TaxID=3273376 RepID=UPI003611F1BA